MPDNIPDGNYLAYQEGWVVSFYVGAKLVTFKAKQEITVVTPCEVKSVNSEFQIFYN